MDPSDLQFFILNWLKVSVKSVIFLEIKNAVIESNAHIKDGITDKRFNTKMNDDKLENDILKGLENLENIGLLFSDKQGEYIFSNAGIFPTKYSLTNQGRAYLKYVEHYGRLRNSDIDSLDCALQYFSPYGTIDFEKTECILKELNIGFNIEIIKNFLIASGFSKIINGQIYLTERGRNLRRIGKLSLLSESENEEKKKEAERIKRQDLFLKYQEKNSKWQNTEGNKIASSTKNILKISLVIACINIVATIFIAIYVSNKTEPPKVSIENKVIIDSSFYKQPPINKNQNGDTTKESKINPKNISK